MKGGLRKSHQRVANRLDATSNSTTNGVGQLRINIRIIVALNVGVDRRIMGPEVEHVLRRS